MVNIVDCTEVSGGRDFISNIEEIKDQMKDMMMTSTLKNSLMKKMAVLFKEENACIEFVFKGKPSGLTATI